MVTVLMYYNLFCLFCFIVIIIGSKVADGYVRLRDFCELFLCCFVPGMNLILLGYGIHLIMKKYGNREIF